MILVYFQPIVTRTIVLFRFRQKSLTPMTHRQLICSFVLKAEAKRRAPPVIYPQRPLSTRCASGVTCCEQRTSLGIARAIFDSFHRTPKYGKFLSGQLRSCSEGTTLLSLSRPFSACARHSSSCLLVREFPLEAPTKYGDA
jgi:hypothetical protein